MTHTALETRAETVSLEELQARRRQMLPEYAELRARHGSFGTWDAKRKQLLEALKIRCRMLATEKGEKVTEGYIDALAHADTQYEQFIDSSTNEKVRYVQLDVEWSEIEEQIRSREIELSVYGKEVSLR